MKKILCKILIITLISLLNANVFSSEMPVDSSKVSIHEFDSTIIENFQNDEDFEYTVEEKKPSILGLFLDWLFRKIGYLFMDESAKPYRILLIIAFIVVLVLVLKRANLQRFMYSEKSVNNNLNSQEIIEEAGEDIDEAIANEIFKKNYRRATRFLYLKLLKLLDENNFIAWEKDKTNFDYMLEIKNPNLKDVFRNLSYIYEYTWYGNFEISQEGFIGIKEDFDHSFKQNFKEA